MKVSRLGTTRRSLQEIEPLTYSCACASLRRDFIQGIQGFVVMSADLDEIFAALSASTKVPALWLKTYPLSNRSVPGLLLMRIDQRQ
jgi:hypothetical protein